LHERDERRDDDGQVLGHEAGELVTERLARARGHDHERVASSQRSLARLALAGAEGREAEVLEQRCIEVHGDDTTDRIGGSEGFGDDS